MVCMFGSFMPLVVMAGVPIRIPLVMDGGIKLVSNGTDNHMMIADLRNLKITGKDAEDALERAGITVNKNYLSDMF